MNLRTIHITFDAAAEPLFGTQLCDLLDDLDMQCFAREAPATAYERVDFRGLFLEDNDDQG